MRKSLLYLFILFIFTSCAYKQYTKQGEKYEEAGMLEQATESYTAALLAKDTYVDAKIGLMRVSTRFATQLEEAIDAAYHIQDDDLVVDNYLKLERLYLGTKNQEIPIIISERTQGQYTEVKSRYIIDHYTKGKKYIDYENFDAALEHLQLVVRVEPNYGDSQDLIRYCKAEPLYRKGVLYMQFKKYRSAYNEFGKALSVDPNFKDAQILRQEALHAGMLTVTFLPVYIPNRYYQPYVETLIAGVNSEVQKANNPFLQMRDRNQAQELQELQKQAMLANQDIDITQAIPTRAALSCKLNELSYYRSKLKRTVKRGFLLEELKNDSVIYHKVNYVVYEQEAEARINFSYSLLSVESGLILFSDNIAYKSTDKINYIVFNGDKKNLYSGHWEKISTPFDPVIDKVDTRNRSAMKSLIYGRTTIKTENEMKNALVNRATQKLSNQLINYNPESDN